MAMNNRLLRPRANGFSPKQIAGLELWFDASVSSSVTLNSGNVSQLDDLSGKGRHLEQGTAANQPSYVTAGQNGKNTIDFGASGGKYLLQSLASAVTLSQPLAFFWAYKTGASGSGVYTITDVKNAAVDGTGRIATFGNAETEIRFFAGANNATAVNTNAWNVASCVFNGASSVRRVNTTTPTTINTGTQSYSDRLVLGANHGFAAFHKGSFGELVIYSGNMTDSASVALLNYLGKKWGVTLA
jgi:hypothetical protein